MKAAIKRMTRWELAKLAFFFFIMMGSVLVFVLTPNLLPSALISVLLFFIFAPLIDAAERKGISRVSAILAIFALCGLGLAFVASTVTPRIALEVSAFQRSGAGLTGLPVKLKAFEKRVLSDFPLLKDAGLTEKLVTWVTQSNDKIWAIVPDIASHLFMVILLVPFLTFVILKDAHEIKRQLLRLVPNRQFETIYGLTSRITDEMGGYVSARIIEAAIMTVLVTVGCLVLQTPYAILLGVFAGATNAIPYLGPLLGAAPGLLMAMLAPSTPNQFIWMLLIYSVANLIDMAVIFPLIVAQIVDLHPVVVVISVVLGSQIFGIVGMIVAVPITSIVKILIQEVYSRVYNNTEPLF